MTTRRVVRAFDDFVRLEVLGGVLVLVAAGIALAWANSPWADRYAEIWNTRITFGAADTLHVQSVRDWVNEGLMTLVFFVFGLEVKRALTVGELSGARQRALPAFAALGGLIVPAAIYLAFNIGARTVHGWGIPMTTDVTVVLALVAVFGRRVPPAFKVVVTALAILDTLAGVTIVALVYRGDLDVRMLAMAGALMIALMLANSFRARGAVLYGVLGIGLWLALLESGVHAAVAGVFTALAIPSAARIHTGTFRARSREMLDRLEAADADPGAHRITGAQLESIYALAGLVQDVETPLQRIERALHPWVTYCILPVFALANAGIEFGTLPDGALSHPITVGVLAGSVIGKLVGVSGFAWVAVASGIGAMPPGVTWRQLTAAGAFAGVGFTMSFFMATLAFAESPARLLAGSGTLLGSGAALMLGVVLLLSDRQPRD